MAGCNKSAAGGVNDIKGWHKKQDGTEGGDDIKGQDDIEGHDDIKENINIK